MTKATRQNRSNGLPENDPTVKLWREWLPLKREVERLEARFVRISNQFPTSLTADIPCKLYPYGWSPTTCIHRARDIDKLGISDQEKGRLHRQLATMLQKAEEAGRSQAWQDWNDAADRARPGCRAILGADVRSLAGMAAKIDAALYKMHDDGAHDQTVFAGVLDQVGPFVPSDLQKHTAKLAAYLRKHAIYGYGT